MNSIVVAFGSAFIVVGVLSLFWMMAARRRARRSLSWPTVQGEVVSAEQGREPDTTTTTKPNMIEATYKYTVGGQEFTSNRLGFDHNWDWDNKMDADRELAKYKPGTKVSVCYNPDDPSICALEPGANSKEPPVLGFLVPVLLMFGGAAILILGR